MIDTIELSLSTDYVSHWGIREAIRELVQNALDAPDPLVQQRSDWTAISNGGPALDRRYLLLGEGTKTAADDKRGQFGEGLKLALLVLARNKVPTFLFTGKEMWVPELRTSERFGVDTLHIQILPCEVHTDGVTVFVAHNGDLSLDFLDLPGIAESIVHSSYNTDYGRVLTEERHRGRIYSNGIFVCAAEGGAKYGYELKRLRVGRDRDTGGASIGSALWYVVASLPDELMLDVVCKEGWESEILAQHGYFLPSPIGRYFLFRYGEDAHPVSHPKLQEDVKAVGYAPVLLSRYATDSIERAIGPLHLRLSNQCAVVRKWSREDLSVAELAILDRASAVCHVTPDEIVDFVDPKIYGSYVVGTIRLARHVLCSLSETVATLIHEKAHLYGEDGTAAHTRAIERISGEIIARLAA